MRAKYGVVAIDALEKVFGDGMNEKGLVVGAFYHPGCARYAEYDAAKSGQSTSSTDVLQYLLATCATVGEVRKALAEIFVVGVVEEAIGQPAPFHLMVTEPSGKQIVVEWIEGETKIYDAPLGVITNAPTYDWHLTNLHNYVNLSPVGLPSKSIEELEFSPLGGGSGMIGLPGDFTPPSRFGGGHETGRGVRVANRIAFDRDPAHRAGGAILHPAVVFGKDDDGALAEGLAARKPRAEAAVRRPKIGCLLLACLFSRSLNW